MPTKRAARCRSSAHVAIKPATALADDCDVVVECLPPPLFREVAISAIDKGRIFMPLSVAQ